MHWPVGTSGSVTGSAATAEQLIIPYSLAATANARAMTVFVVHEGSVLDGPEYVRYGGQDATFYASQSTSLAEATVECWIIPRLDCVDGSFDVFLGSGASSTLLVWGMELGNWGHAPFLDANPYISISGGGPLAGTGFSDSIQIDDTTSGAGRTGTVAVPATDGLILGVGIVKSVTANIASISGSSDGTMTNGAGASRIVADTLVQAPTGGVDTIEWSVGLGTTDPYAYLAIGVVGAALAGIIQCPGMIVSRW